MFCRRMHRWNDAKGMLNYELSDLWMSAVQLYVLLVPAIALYLASYSCIY